jgi:hypothetical protein
VEKHLRDRRKDQVKRPNPLEKIIFISIHENYTRTIGSFTVDPAVLIPVEIPGNDPEPRSRTSPGR